jgi:predicted SprT family Zn-dependent metalloprotease
MIDISQSTLQAWTEEYNQRLFGGGLDSTLVVWAMKLLSTAGKTKFYRIANRCEIELNPKLLDDERKVRNTLVHELCHAAVFMIDKDASDGHGPKWQRWVNLAMAIDSKLEISVYHHYRSSYKFHYVCSAAHGRCRIAYGTQNPLAPSALNKYRCRQCVASLKYAAAVPDSLYLAHILKARRMAPSWASPTAVEAYAEASPPSIDMPDLCCSIPSRTALHPLRPASCVCDCQGHELSVTLSLLLFR